ncbi:hypothetical protein CROQUDRAFT_658117 [Cronartium quercuum f. sp. fusiforme G11]|uniref:Carboxypeptidase n=1 Tax=Cronartium quercuum f. sp. fusiforme G11 TaxID=708437 RepID=A0A9P6TB45_9BASI|nr:hypothetical protein CROQUDRAFT_658117 [Cronartium quercuum f. sp. fusiforme G11]
MDLKLPTSTVENTPPNPFWRKMKYLSRTRGPTLSLSFLILLGMRILHGSASSSFEVVPTHSESHLVDSNSLPWATGATPISPSYAGLTTVRKTSEYEAKLFYWLFPCATDPSAPLVIWLQGGPLSSSMIGLFYESGPLRVRSKFKTKDLRRNETINDFLLSNNPASWHHHFNIVFLDQPAGTGYSFVDPPLPPQAKDGGETGETLVRRAVTLGCSSSGSCPTESSSSDPDYKSGYVTNESGVSRDFLSFLQQFYERYPSLKSVDLILSSESYGGKYVPAIATAITEHNSKAQGQAIPLKSLTIGNQWTHPYAQIATNIDQLLYFGLISTQQAANAAVLMKQAQEFIIQKDWRKALDRRTDMFNLLANYTGDVDWFDVRMKNSHRDETPMNHFLRCKETKKALHVPDKYRFGRDDGMFDIFMDDIMQSTKDLFPDLFKRYKVLLYQGNMDLRDGVVSNTAWLSALEWEGRAAFEAAPRQLWKSTQGELFGYVTEAGNLTRVVLLGCGHLVPADDGCPNASLEMMTRHTRSGTFI